MDSIVEATLSGKNLMNVECMAFNHQITSTFIGALLAFIFSLFLFYLTEKWKNSRVNRNLGKNLQKEFEYNLQFLEAYKDDFDKLLRQISSRTPFPTMIFRFYKLQRIFLLEAFSKGLLYEHLEVDDITDLDAMLAYFNNTTDTWAWNYFNSYTQKKIAQQAALDKFEHDKSQIEKYIKVQKKLKKKLKKLK